MFSMLYYVYLSLGRSVVFCLLFCCVFFFFKQKTAYEMRISDWSSDVCSSDLLDHYPDMTQARLEKLGREAVARWGLLSVRIIQIGRASCRERVCQYV